jgi:hypothetical protein
LLRLLDPTDTSQPDFVHVAADREKSFEKVDWAFNTSNSEKGLDVFAL